MMITTNTTNDSYHTPVMLNESIDGLALTKHGIYIDCTFGGGGHAKEILNRIGKNGQVIAFDKDEYALEKNEIKDTRLQLINSDYKYTTNYLNALKTDNVSGILADLGVSSLQLDKKKEDFHTVSKMN